MQTLFMFKVFPIFKLIQHLSPFEIQFNMNILIEMAKLLIVCILRVIILEYQKWF